ncbi:Putative_papain-like cysteine peptidase (DUF1796) [Hexamita inflata]|uniref:Papain-like cysteine peptidase (DUF1796) n=1 Tax=Hexamita inflata TaxID=28002 RepID=A0AA86PS20_9EUKA|nr:Putative papain-like cysteine peptidase (DUF1796) [Hexamita inflata]
MIKNDEYSSYQKYLEYELIKVSNIWFVSLNPQAQFKEMIETLQNLSNAEYFCSWSSTTFHDSSRVSLQMTQMELDNTKVSVLKQVPTYHYEDGSVTLNEDPEQQLETVLFRRDCLENISQYSSIKDLALQITQQNAVSYVSSTTAYLDLSDKYKKSGAVLDESASKYLVNLARPKQRFDAVISLGAWCQVGSIQDQRGLQIIHSPFSGMGFNQWERLMDVLDSNFENYWERENMVVGRATDFFSYKYWDVRKIHHVYDNYYNMFSGHHFNACDCVDDKFAPYEEFKRKMDLRMNVFRAQMKLNRVLFVLKIMNKKEDTIEINIDLIKKLMNSLQNLRENKPFDLILSVPKKYLRLTQQIILDLDLKNVSVYGWKIQWNSFNTVDEEWNAVFGNAVLSYGSENVNGMGNLWDFAEDTNT